jgi:sulfoxide reductase catalytic subunit YedY
MLIKPAPDIRSSEITDKKLYLNRREFIRATTGPAVAVATGAIGGEALLHAAPPAAHGRKLENVKKSPLSADEKANTWEQITTYNNYYEFGTDKDDPSRNATHLRTRPWKVEIAGEVKRPAVYDLDDLLKPFTPVERVYRLRCVEAWSMVIPWLGIPLRDIIDRLEPTSKAKYVEVTTLLDPQQMPGQQRRILDWPYVEALRMDEARHPLTLIVTGLYGKQLPNQNGAPLRLIVPWKYGFKGGKSIVKIRFTEQQPMTTWSIAAPNEYGFYANVNPEVDHPRWSQARERRVGEFFKRKTLMFNGYADQVASLYAGMDLRRNF